MKVHANAALGPAGRLALVQAIESGMTQKARLLRGACNGPPLVASLALGRRGATELREVVARPLLTASSPATPTLGCRRGSDLASTPADQPRSRSPG